MGNKETKEYNFFEKYPKCQPYQRPIQLENDCWAHTESFAYSLRNCSLQHQNVIENHDDILVRTPHDVRKSTYPNGRPCGDGVNGGDTVCAAKYLERLDGNPVKQINEKNLKNELESNGPVVATFTVRQDFLDHLKSNKDTPYVPNSTAELRGSHATTIVGYGVTEDGKTYWKCIDSNIDKERKFYEYKIQEKPRDINWQLLGHCIKNPIPIAAIRQKEFNLGHWKPLEPEEQFWSGALPPDYVQSGAQDIYEEWKRGERQN